MTAERAIRMSVINAVMQIQQWIAQNGIPDIPQAVNAMSAGAAGSSSYDYGTANTVLEHRQELITPSFAERELEVRRIVSAMIEVYRPTWRYVVPFGRGYLKDHIEGTNALQCLEASGLYLQEMDDLAMSWWDMLAGAVRSDQDNSRLAQGRGAEQKTVDFERVRLSDVGFSHLQVEWSAYEDNSLGYDVASYSIEHEEPVPLFIEVKSCLRSDAQFYISRNEWDTAQRLGDRYALYIWHGNATVPIILRLEDIAASVPSDNGTGEWADAIIRVS